MSAGIQQVIQFVAFQLKRAGNPNRKVATSAVKIFCNLSHCEDKSGYLRRKRHRSTSAMSAVTVANHVLLDGLHPVGLCLVVCRTFAVTQRGVSESISFVPAITSERVMV